MPETAPAPAHGPAHGPAQTQAARLDNAALLYEGGRGLHPTSLDVRKGERLALIGANGSGKSTLMRMLATLAQPTSGVVSILGADTVNPAARRGVRSRIAVCTAEPMLDPILTIRENLELSGRFARLSKPDIRARIEARAIDLDITARLDDRVATLSTGLKRRADLARTMLHDADLLLLDEPSASLDEHSAARLSGLLAQREAAGAATVIITHDLAEARRATRLACLLDGRVAAIVRTDAVDALLERRIIRWSGPAVAMGHTRGAVAWDHALSHAVACDNAETRAAITAQLDAAGVAYSVSPVSIVDIPAMLAAEGVTP